MARSQTFRYVGLYLTRLSFYKGKAAFYFQIRLPNSEKRLVPEKPMPRHTGMPKCRGRTGEPKCGAYLCSDHTH